jgi:hypothetical protein
MTSGSIPLYWAAANRYFRQPDDAEPGPGQFCHRLWQDWLLLMADKKFIPSNEVSSWIKKFHPQLSRNVDFGSMWGETVSLLHFSGYCFQADDRYDNYRVALSRREANDRRHFINVSGNGPSRRIAMDEPKLFEGDNVLMNAFHVPAEAAGQGADARFRLPPQMPNQFIPLGRQDSA